MGFSFEKFTETETSFDARVTIRRTGQIGFNAGAKNSYNIGDYEFVVLYFDREKRAVGLELTNEQVPGAITRKKSAANTYVRAKNFCDRYQMDYSESRKFALRKDAETGYLYFCLDEAQNEREKGDRAEDETEES